MGVSTLGRDEGVAASVAGIVPAGKDSRRVGALRTGANGATIGFGRGDWRVVFADNRTWDASSAFVVRGAARCDLAPIGGVAWSIAFLLGSGESP